MSSWLISAVFVISGILISRTSSVMTIAKTPSCNPSMRRGVSANDVVDADGRIIDNRQAGIHDLAEIMRRNIGGHADRNAARTVDQQVGDARRQDGWFLLLAVVVVHKIDGFAIDIGQQF